MRIKIDEDWIDVGEQYQEPKPRIRKCLFCHTLLPNYKNNLLCRKHEEEIESKYDLFQLS